MQSNKKSSEVRVFFCFWLVHLPPPLPPSLPTLIILCAGWIPGPTSLCLSCPRPALPAPWIRHPAPAAAAAMCTGCAGRRRDPSCRRPALAVTCRWAWKRIMDRRRPPIRRPLPWWPAVNTFQTTRLPSRKFLHTRLLFLELTIIV